MNGVGGLVELPPPRGHASEAAGLGAGLQESATRPMQIAREEAFETEHSCAVADEWLQQLVSEMESLMVSISLAASCESEANQAGTHM